VCPLAVGPPGFDAKVCGSPASTASMRWRRTASRSAPKISSMCFADQLLGRRPNHSQ
jgi:hypothetical protein